MVNDAPLAQESKIAGKKNTVCANQVCYYRKDSVPVEIRSRSSIIPHVSRNALYLRHQTVKRWAAAPESSYKAYVGKGCQEGYDILQGNIAFTRVDVAYGFATVREY